MFRKILRFISMGINGIIALIYIPAGILIALWAFVIIKSFDPIEVLMGIIIFILGVELVSCSLGCFYLVFTHKKGWKFWLGLGAAPLLLIPTPFIFTAIPYVVAFNL